MASERFIKQILRVGHYPLVDLDVTPERIRNWTACIEKLQARGYVIPVHWDHPMKKDDCLPIRKNRLQSARNTVGLVESFEPSHDGQAAIVVLRLLTPEAQRSAMFNIVFVSPVIFTHFVDGFGNEYEDVLVSIDLVDFPVDAWQTPFEPYGAYSFEPTQPVPVEDIAPSRRLPERRPLTEDEFTEAVRMLL